MARRSTPTLLSAALIPVLAATLALAAAAQEAAPRSAVHPIVPVESTGPPPAYLAYSGAAGDQALVCAAGDWSVYSPGVNRITGVAVVGDRTWLSTGFGVKLVDRKARTVQHYTRLEGLPGDYMADITADRDDVWCAAASARSGRQTVGICRQDRKSGHWEVVRELPVPFGPPLYTPYPAQPRPLLALTSRALVFFAPPSRESKPVLYVYDRGGRRWDDVSWDAPVPPNQIPLVAYQLEASGDAVWLATNVGLQRFNLRAHKWDRFLPDHQVTALAIADQTVWAVSRPGAGDNPYFGPRNAGPSAWTLTRMDARTGELKDIPVKATRNGYSPQAFTSITLVDGVAWLESSTPFGQGLMQFQRYDTKTEQWSTFNTQGNTTLDGVPDPVLLHATSGSGFLSVSQAAHRFPGFLCPTEPVSPQVPRPRYPGGEVRTPTAPVWAIENNRILTRRDRTGTTVERFTPPESLLRVNPEILSVTHVGDTLVVKTASGLFALAPGQVRWRRLPLPLPEANADYQYRVSVLGQENALWIMQSGILLRYDLSSDQFRVAAELGSNDGSQFRLAAVTGEAAYLIDGQQRLERLPLNGAPPDPVQPALPPSIRGESAAPTTARPLNALAVTGDIAWFLASPGSPGGQFAVIGYRLATGSWTAPYFYKDLSPAGYSFLNDGSSVYVVAGSRTEAPIQRYDRETNRWEPVAPPLPSENVYANSLQLVSVSPARLIGVDPNTGAVWELNRKANLWTIMRGSGGQRSSGHEESAATQIGDTLYVGTGTGVWSVDLAGREWSRHPLPATAGLSFTEPVADHDAVWMIARAGSSGGPVGVVRFTPSTREWKTWTEADGVPSGSYVQRLVPDGSSAWLLMQNQALRLNTRSQRWEIVSVSANRETVDIPHVIDVVADGGQTWLLLGRGEQRLGGSAAGKPAVLARYDPEVGAGVVFAPDVPGALRGTAMLVEERAIWVITSDGYYRFDKTTHAWQRLQSPLTPERVGIEGADRIFRDGDYLWFTNPNQASRWKERQP